jgi:hypothetical protein
MLVEKNGEGEREKEPSSGLATRPLPIFDGDRAFIGPTADDRLKDMRSTRVALFSAAVFCFLFSARLPAQALQKSQEECLKLVPGDWGPNFGQKWKQHESVYWGCRVGVSEETVGQWQHFSAGMIQELIPVTVGGEQLVIMESMGGSAHCIEIDALRNTSTGWQRIWSPPANPDSMDDCTLGCPPIRIEVAGKNLTLEKPYSSDPTKDQTPSCTHVKWNKESFHWDGRTYRPAKARLQSKIAQTKP